MSNALHYTVVGLGTADAVIAEARKLFAINGAAQGFSTLTSASAALLDAVDAVVRESANRDGQVNSVGTTVTVNCVDVPVDTGE